MQDFFIWPNVVNVICIMFMAEPRTKNVITSLSVYINIDKKTAILSVDSFCKNAPDVTTVTTACHTCARRPGHK